MVKKQNENAAPKGKRKSGRKAGVAVPDARKHGLYSRVLTGEDKRRLEEVSVIEPADLFEENYYWVQSRILAAIEGDINHDRQSRLVMDLCRELAEQGELSEAFVKRLGLKLAEMDLPQIAGIMNQSVGLIEASRRLSAEGEARAQIRILRSFLIDTMKMSGEVPVRQRALQALTELKIEAGLPLEEMERVLRIANQNEEPGDDQDPPEDDDPWMES